MINEQVRDYKIIRKLGEGGMGSVYLAEDTQLERKVAVKVLNPIFTSNTELIGRFKQEAKLQASLIHPNIVALYHFFLESDSYCMVMEYAEGETLKELIKRTGPIPEARSLNILKQIADGLGYAHSKGIIHRDVKPSNIMIDTRDSVKVMDFGIAKIMGDQGLTRTGMKMGTVLYMSPEQVKAEKDIDQRTDIYSLGITLYEMLTGRIPFNTDTESDFEIMNEIVNGEFPNPRDYYPQITENTIRLFYKMAHKSKHERTSSINKIFESGPIKDVKQSEEYTLLLCSKCGSTNRIFKKDFYKIDQAKCYNCKSRLLDYITADDVLLQCSYCKTKNLINKTNFSIISNAHCSKCKRQLITFTKV